jgi:site-specific DNA recombinase
LKKVTKIAQNTTDLTEQAKLRVAAYCRVSTDSDEQLESLDTQIKHYESYINANPEWEFAGLYYDEGITGTKKEKRPELLRMITDCENRKIDLIVTKSISRFARNTTDCLELVRKLLDLGVFIYFEKENINTGSMESELMLSILSGLAENESFSIAENSKWAIKRRFQNGTYKISYPPYGYDNVDGEMVVNKFQAKIVRLIFSEILAGKGTNKIADDLNRRKIPTKKGGRWTSTTIRGMVAITTMEKKINT